jgi:hypothetical protein
MTSGDITACGFAAIGVACLAIELAARRPASRIPTLGQTAGFIMRERWGRLGILFVWWWIGWHFLSRS